MHVQSLLITEAIVLFYVLVAIAFVGYHQAIKRRFLENLQDKVWT